MNLAWLRHIGFENVRLQRMSQRIQGLEQNEAPRLARPIYWVVKRMFGKVLTPIKVQARRPGIAWFGSLLGMAIDKSGKIEKSLHTLVQLRAAQVVECPF
jgi:hypothetical protein